MKRIILHAYLLALFITGCGARGGAIIENSASTNLATSVANTFEQCKETKHFTVYSHEKDKDCLKDLCKGLESAYSKVTADFDCLLDYKVEVTVYPDIEALHGAIGYTDGIGQDYYITAATIGKHIYITSPLNPGPVRDYDYMVNSSTFHEFTHVVINNIAKSDTWPVNIPRWLNESMASLEGGPPMPTMLAPQSANIHEFFSANDFANYYLGLEYKRRSFGTYNALVDLMGHKDLGEKTVLLMLDALYTSRNQDEAVSSLSKWKMKPFNNDFVSSIFMSQDGVAIDSVGYDFLNSEQTIKNQDYSVLDKGNTADNYLIEAALANNPPSRTKYDPEGDGTTLKSLGVHEHWNNPVDKKYSRNLGTGNGIELVRVD